MKQHWSHILAALAITIALLLTGYSSFGFWTTVIFSGGFVGGFLMWFFLPSPKNFKSIKLPYWLTLFSFIALHRVEENVMKFQEKLSGLTGNPIPKLSDPALIILVLVSVGGWLLIPILLKRRHWLGQYLAWTFFASMGITELAHFVFPFLAFGDFGYFPGLLSVVALAPLAWWGMYRMTHSKLFDK